jgi:hypothetical protein
MNLRSLKKLAGPRVGLATLTVKKYSPELMVASGLGSGLLAAILLARAHKKSEEQFSNVFEQLDAIRDAIEENNFLVEEAEATDQELPEGAHIIEKTEEVKTLIPLYLTFVKQAAVLYGPSILLGLLSVGMIVGSHGILKRRNQALFSTIVVLERGFNVYRERVRKELGEDGDNRFLYGLESRKETIITTDKDGKKKKKRVTKDVLSEGLSPLMYQRNFDSTNLNWKNSERTNHFWLGVVQGMMNDQLEAEGYVILNDVYKALGIDKTPEGAVVGWSLAADGDDFIDFGVEKPWNDYRPDGSIRLDFNVNGSVYEYIGLTSAFKSFKR